LSLIGSTKTLGLMIWFILNFAELENLISKKCK
jgi:hypothetical protein